MSNRKHSVWIGQCLKTIIFSLIAFLTILLPYSINNGITHTLDYLPILGNEKIIADQFGVINNFFGLFGLSADTFYFIFKNNVTFFYLILLSNVVFSLILIIAQANFLRVIVKTLSVLFGLCMIVISLSYLAIIVSIIYGIFTNYYFSGDILLSLKTCGIIYYFVTIFFSIILIRKQFGWFSRRTW